MQRFHSMTKSVITEKKLRRYFRELITASLTDD